MSRGGGEGADVKEEFSQAEGEDGGGGEDDRIYDEEVRIPLLKSCLSTRFSALPGHHHLLLSLPKN